MRAQGARLDFCREMSLLLWSKRPWGPGDTGLGCSPAGAQAGGGGEVCLANHKRVGGSKGLSGREQRALSGLSYVISIHWLDPSEPLQPCL